MARHPRWCRPLPLLALAALTAGEMGTARANGAFPDEFSIHFPPNAPHRILMGANFGMLVSEDDGDTWRYSCEPWVVAGSNAALSNASVSFYQVTADDAVLADSLSVTRSEDVACTWPTSTGAVTGHTVADVFPDPNDASFVVAIVILINPVDIVSYIIASHDGGRTFDTPHLYETPDLLTSVEIARSKPGVLYATSASLTRGDAQFLASTDRGAHWTATPLTLPMATEPRILTIDPDDERKVYLRLVTTLSDSVFMTKDSGQSFETVLPSMGAQLSSFLRGGDGTIYAGTRTGKLYVQPTGVTGFTVRDAPHLRCLGQRPGTSRIYACSDMVIDGYSLATSDDQGLTFQPLMSFTELLGPLTCAPVQTNCAAHWQRIQGVLGIQTFDGGIPGGPDAGTADAGTSPPPVGSKSGCSSAAGRVETLLGLLVLSLLGAGVIRRRTSP